MQYVRTVDLSAFSATEFESRVFADRGSGLDSCICIVTRVPPGKGTPQGLHVHPADQLYFILSGRMSVQIGDRELTAGPKQLVYIPAGLPHRNWNAGAEDEVHFEWIVPQPPAGEPVYTTVDATKTVAAPAGVAFVRPLDESRLAADDRWSQVVLADRASGVSSVSVGVFRVPPSVRLGRLHVHRFDQIYYVISGRMRLQVGLEEYTAGPNTLVILPAGMPHRNWNEGPEAELHLNLRVPEPEDPDVRTWDLPVRIGE